jgi:heme A synthase
MIQQYPTQTTDLQRPDPPASLLRAVKVMYAGAILGPIHAVIYVVTAGATKRAIEAKHPYWSASLVAATTHIAVIGGAVIVLMAAMLYVWIARSCRSGKNWARVTGTVLFAVAVLLAAYNLGPGVETTLNMIFNFTGILIGLVAVVLLWRRASSAYFAFFKRPQF